jgi:hypothetical protein
LILGAILRFESEFWSDKREIFFFNFCLFFLERQTELRFRSFKIPELMGFTRSSNFFATELPKPSQTSLHSDNPEFFGSRFFWSRERERERERERDKEIER